MTAAPPPPSPEPALTEKQPKPGRPTDPRRPPFVLAVAILAAAGALIGGWLWLRDSSLVAIRKVTVVGLGGRDTSAARRALVSAARGMTTLHVSTGKLQAAVKAYPIVRRLRVDTDFPHGARIIVTRYVPVAAVLSGATRIPVAPDGTLLRNTPAAQVPVIPAVRAPAGDRLSNRRALEAVKLLARAPQVLRARLARAYVGQQGLTAVFRDGPAIYFGDDGRLIAKWAAAVRVLADTTSGGAAYVDVRVPERPAAGGLAGVDTSAAPEPAPPAPPPPPAPVPPPTPPPPAPAAETQGQPST